MDRVCSTCEKYFPSGGRALQQHIDATGHDVTCPCGLIYCDVQDRDEHAWNYDHWPHECHVCTDAWPSQEAAGEHEVESHLYCAPCDRYFQNENSIKMHLNSRTHKGQNLECPFCTRLYTTATGIAHHLENGACSNAPGLNRDQIYRLVKSKDPEGVLTKNLIGWAGSYEYEATEAAWNGRAYECYICHRDFSRVHSLSQHLNSVAHQQDLYHCPNRQCGRDFTNLAAVINHMESETCGYIRFAQVQKTIGGLIKVDRLITL